MPGFNTSLKKDDLSLKLRAQNLKNARDQTKRLEEDNRKMEERLKELKTAMKREKEVRERQGAGFWGRGQPNTGSLTNYASEVLQNNVMASPPEGKIKKVKVLRDEPIGKPKQIGPPGTMKYIAQRKLTTGATPRDKQKGPKCGQCEDRTATLSCIQCSEIYCPGCFAAFHLKGALKQHRSVPLSAAGPRVCMSPSTSADVLSPRGGQAASGLVPTQPYNECEMNGSEAAGASSSQPSPHTTAPTLLQGEYDESQSAASFQAALMAWRQGEQPVTHQSVRLNQGKPISMPAVAVDESTGMSEELTIPNIKFTSSLSYAEKLLLKKHLRMKLAEISLGVDSSHVSRPGRQLGNIHQVSEKMSARSASQLHSQGSFSRSETPMASSNHPTRSSTDPRNSSRGTERDVDSRLSPSADEDGHVDFQSLFEVVALSKSPERNGPRPGPSLSEVSIVELFQQGKPVVSDVPNCRPTYTVKEVSPLESWKTEHLQQKEVWTPAVVDDGYTQFNSAEIHVHHHDEENPQLDKSASKSSFSSLLPTSASSLDQNCLIISELTNDDKSISGNENCDSTGYHFEDEDTGIEDVLNALAGQQRTSKPLPKPVSAKSHTTRTVAELSKASRTSSRAASRAGMEGCLTKVPSEALKMVVQMMHSPGYSCPSLDPLEGFFLAGVTEQQPEQVADRVITPFRKQNKTPRAKSRSEGVKSARQEKEAIKISNKLYQMAPRSWHPETSLTSAVPLNEVKLDREQGETTLSFSYGKQMSGQEGIDWHSSSSHILKDIPDDDHASESDLLFGDEMFVSEATAAANSLLPSSHHRHGDVHLETSKYSSGDQQPVTPQTTKIHGGRRFHNIIMPDGKSDRLKELKISPVPPNSTSEHRLQPKISASTLERSKYQHDVTENERTSFENLKKNLNKSKTTKDEQKLFRKSTDSSEATNSLNKSSSLKPKAPFSRIKQNQSPVKTNTIVGQEDEIKTTARSRVQTSLEKQEVSDFRRNFNKMFRDQKVDSTSDRRPNSSVTMSKQDESSRMKKSARAQRPNSSSGGTEPQGKQQISPKSGTDTIVSDMFKSKVQEDGWINSESAFSYDYDDGDHLSARCLFMQNTETPISNVKKSEIWETDVRPFSNTSISAKSGHLQTKAVSAKGDYKKASRPPSGRSASAVSQRSGRTSRAIVIDGDDLSCYDSLDASAEQNMEDRQALEQLEWELASNTGRLTADGKISHMRFHDNDNLGSSTAVKLSTSSSEKDYNVGAQLLEDEKQAARNVESLELKRSITIHDIDEVKALR